MALKVEIGTSQFPESKVELKAQSFYSKFRRHDQAWVACFIPECETPIRFGWSEFRNGKPAGYVIKSVLSADGVSYRSDCPRGYSHFSAQPRMVVDVESVEGGIDIIKLFREIGSRAQLDDRYCDRVRINVGACQVHSRKLNDLEIATIGAGNRINREILENIVFKH